MIFTIFLVSTFLPIRISLNINHKLKEIHFNYSCQLKEVLSKIDSHSLHNRSVNGSNAPSVELKLPPIKIPTFDGSLKMWPEFKSLFEAMLNKNTSISDVHKLQYLKYRYKL